MSVDDHEILARVSLFGSTTYPQKKTKKRSINAQPISSVNCKQSLKGVTVTFPGFVVLGCNPFKENFPEILVQNSVDRFGPTGKVSKKLVHLGPLFPVGIWLNGSRLLTFEQLSQVI